MAKTDDIKRLIGSYGRPEAFRSAAMQIIASVEKSRNPKLALPLRQALDANVGNGSLEPKSLATLANATDTADELLEVIEPARDRSQIVLSKEGQSLVDGLIEEHQRSEELRRHNLPIRNKILFCGPPGCGKTLAAEVLARELSLPLYTAKLDVIISSFLGETSSNLRKVFDVAMRRPCVLFLDEFDALARNRSDGSEHNELRRVVNTLLMFVDRFKGRGLVIAATNLESTLDSAVWRRFDEVIVFDPPGEREITTMLALRFRNFPVNFDLDKQISKLRGMSYAEIERVSLEATKSAVLKRRKVVSETEFASAIKSELRRKAAPKRASVS
ncbi:MAG: ATP-binding protein [Hyphomicrobiales bacterium]|nr:ATP-binding protein [Hyphomicrobiales bacterium]